MSEEIQEGCVVVEDQTKVQEERAELEIGDGIDVEALVSEESIEEIKRFISELAVSIFAKPEVVEPSPIKIAPKYFAKEVVEEEKKAEDKKEGEIEITEKESEEIKNDIILEILEARLDEASPEAESSRKTYSYDQYPSYSHPDDKKSEYLKPLTDTIPDGLIDEFTSILTIRTQFRESGFVDPIFNLMTNESDSDVLRYFDPCTIDWHREGFGWKHINDIQKRYNVPFKIYDDNIHPNDIVQGKLGSCFFLSAISALAERPALVKRIFEGTHLDPSGAQGVWINVAGVWRQIVIDDFYPARNSGEFAFAHGRNGNLWVSMLEKAYAKAYKSYAAIDGGTGQNALRDLTGAPVERIKNDLKEDPNGFWYRLIDFDRKGYIMVAGKDNKEGEGQVISGQTERKHLTGLISGHEYSLIAAKEVIGSDHRQHRIVQLRNPWGKTEWNGDFSDESPLWTPELRSQLRVEITNDGTFWMPFENFCYEFEDVSVAKFEPDYTYNYVQKKVNFDSRCKSFSVLIHIKTAGEYYFSLDQKTNRCFSEKYYPFVRLTIVRIENGSATYHGSSFGSHRNQFFGKHTPPGTYVAMIDLIPVEFPPPAVVERKVTFSTYGVDLTSLQILQISKRQMTLLGTAACLDVAGQSNEKWAPNGGDLNVGGLVIRNEKKNVPDWGVTIYRFNAVAGSSQYQLKTAASATLDRSANTDPDEDRDTLEVETSLPGVFYAKSNDYSVNMTAQLTYGAPNGNYEADLNYVVDSLSNVPSLFPICTTSDGVDRGSYQNEYQNQSANSYQSYNGNYSYGTY